MWAVLPLKVIKEAKTRLSLTLSPEQRERLMLSMIEDVLTALTNCSSIEGILIVSKAPEAESLARKYHTELLNSDEDSNLNSAVKAAFRHLHRRDVSQCMVLHGDLPLIQSQELNQLAEAAGNNDVTLIPCSSMRGTNILVTPIPHHFEFQYGDNSYRLHAESAANSGREVHRVISSTAALDVNTPEDLDRLCEKLSAGLYKETHTHAYLNRLKLLSDRVHTLEQAVTAELPTDEQALGLAVETDTQAMMIAAARLRDLGHGNRVSYSPKVFIPLTHLCRDVCHYCTYAKTPRHIKSPYMSVDEVLTLARNAVNQNCREALFTLGEKPELRYRVAREALAEMGFNSTLEYLAHIAQRVVEETGLIPHINAGCMNAEEVAMLRDCSASMGIMLESSSERLCKKGMPHYGSPDKLPANRLETIKLAGEAQVPFTSGILIGIGETRIERMASLLELRRLHRKYGHIQEIIVQNFRAKPGTLMADATEPGLDDIQWTIAAARIIFGPEMSIQAPPNLSPDDLSSLINAGINDWGGVSPLTPDYVNPEAPWPHLEQLRKNTRMAGKFLLPRLTIYPKYATHPEKWLSPKLRVPVLQSIDTQGYAREDNWLTGISDSPPAAFAAPEVHRVRAQNTSSLMTNLLEKIHSSGPDSLTEEEIATLFTARGDDFHALRGAANRLRRETNGDTVTYVVNRNINYTNICYFKCQFCAFSKGKVNEETREKPYNLDLLEIQNRCAEALELGATEVCLQGGIHPDYSGATYLNIVQAIKERTPSLHIHAFSPLEIRQGAQTLGISVEALLTQLKDAGLNTLPGTAAEILDDEVREVICPDKINTANWMEVIETAHRLGIRTTATIMFGHVDSYIHWARHLRIITSIQRKTGGITEFVPLPYVASEAPMYRKGQSRKGPTFREAVLMHAIARLILHPHIKNIQTSWVKMGPLGARYCLNSGANDMGGTLIDESITRSAGAIHGRQLDPQRMRALIRSLNRIPRQRNTLYGFVSSEEIPVMNGT